MKKFSDYNKKQQNNLRNIFRISLQVIFLVLVPGGFVGALAGLKNLSLQLGKHTAISMNPFLWILVSLLLYTFVFGRFFCGFACPFGSLSDWIYDFSHFLAKKLHWKIPSIPDHITKYLLFCKYFVLLAILTLSYLGLYGRLQGSSPWDVFSRIIGLNFHLQGYTIGIVLLILLCLAMVLERRFFCRFLCPMGAVFSLVPVLPFFALTRDRETCIPRCKACSTVCPSRVSLPYGDEISVSGECIMCQKCTAICPRQNIRYGIRTRKGHGFLFTLLRSFILLALLLYLGF